MCVESESKSFHDEPSSPRLGENIEKSVSMFEAAKDNLCNEYNPWNYNLLNNGSINKTISEDDDGQDLNNSMVNDLVAKILDDDGTSNEIIGQHYNGNLQEYQAETLITEDCKIKLGANAYFTNIDDLHSTHTPLRVQNGLFNINEDNYEYKSICSGLNAIGLNLCIDEESNDKGNLYSNGYNNNLQRTYTTSDNSLQPSGQQYQSVNNGSFGSVHDSCVPLVNNCLLTSTTNNLNYDLQSISWSDSSPTIDSDKNSFGHYPQLQTCNNGVDYNLNLALDSPTDSIILNEVQQLHYSVTPPNSHCNSVLNIHDSYTLTANCQGYRPNSTVTELNADSDFLSNTILQNISSADSILHKSYINNLQSNKYEEYKNYYETTTSVNNFASSNEQMYLKQQQNSCKLDDVMCTAEQSYKHLINHYPNLIEQQKQQQQIISSDELDCNHRMALVNQQRFDATFLKMLNSPKSVNNITGKTSEKQVFSPIGYSCNLATNTIHETEQHKQFKLNYSNVNCQRLIANSSDAFKAIQQQNSQAVFQNDYKRLSNLSNSYKMKATYELASNFNFSNNTLTQQNPHLISGNKNNVIEHEIFNCLLKQQRTKNMPQISSAADVLFNASLIQSASVFPAHAVMPITVAVPAPAAIFENSLGLRNGSSNRRSLPSRILFLRLEQTYEQFKQLEKERKKCEAGLAAHFPGKRVSSTNNIPIPKLQGGSSRVDRLIIDHHREHARIITLIAKMERLRAANMNQRVHKAMEQWLDSIKYVQECRKQEIFNGTKRQKDSHCLPGQIHTSEDNVILTLADSIYKLTKASRYARTAMYNAMQLTLLYDSEVESKILKTKQDFLSPVLRPKEASLTIQSAVPSSASIVDIPVTTIATAALLTMSVSTSSTSVDESNRLA